MTRTRACLSVCLSVELPSSRRPSNGHTRRRMDSDDDFARALGDDGGGFLNLGAGHDERRDET